MTTTSSLSTTAAGLVLGLGVLSSGLLNLPMGALADHAGRRRLIAAGGVVTAFPRAFGRAKLARALLKPGRTPPTASKYRDGMRRSAIARPSPKGSAGRTESSRCAQFAPRRAK